MSQEAYALLRIAMADMVKIDDFDKWVNTPNPSFGNKTPSSLIEEGREQELWDMVFELSSGMPG